ncbi:MAG TPA: hypothetical protein VFD57_02650 [Clostridia bacterium]|nr:hypothetical protein [Clostridia bacterium]
MEQFALIGVEDKENRYIKKHPVLRLLPTKWAEAMIPKTKPILTDTIYVQDSKKELGYIMDVPGFFVEKKKIGDANRKKLISNIVDLLVKNNIKTLVFPLWREFMSIEERGYLETNSIIMLDGYFLRLLTLIMTLERIFSIPRVNPHIMEVGIWGADTRMGKVWAELLAPFLNYMTLGGENTIVLEALSDKVLHKTGLSCSVTTDFRQCLGNKTLAILGEMPEDQSLINSKIVVFFGNLWNEDARIRNEEIGSIFMESGWPTIPDKLNVGNDLSLWDQIGVLEARIFMLDETYRSLLLDGEISIANIEKLKRILKDYDIIDSSGMISNNELLSYDSFRRLYFC